jgi:hypothetical protein
MKMGRIVLVETSGNTINSNIKSSAFHSRKKSALTLNILGKYCDS